MLAPWGTCSWQGVEGDSLTAPGPALSRQASCVPDRRAENVHATTGSGSKARQCVTVHFLLSSWQQGACLGKCLCQHGVSWGKLEEGVMGRDAECSPGPQGWLGS